MFQKKPKKLRTQELSPAPLFQPILVKFYDSQKLKHQNEIKCKAFYHFYINFPQVSLQPNREIVTNKKNKCLDEYIYIHMLSGDLCGTFFDLLSF